MNEALNIIGGADATLILLIAIMSIIGYVLGDISPAILIGRAHGIDIKKEGSGNAGTTNVLRVLGKKAAIGTLLIDIGKGVLAVLLGKAAGYYYATAHLMLSDEMSIHYIMLTVATFGGVFAFFGHIWPLAFGFKGGKGVATAFGVLVAINPLMGLLCLLVVAIVVLLFKMVSLGSICGAASLPFIAWWLEPVFIPAGILMAIVVVVKHRSNVVRIIHGEESKLFGSKK